jgi:radical SAM superfamily enzyme YgiQ (UPF0313 family)
MAPYPGFKEGRDNLHVNYANTTYGQGIFSVPLATHANGLHLIAQNIPATSIVLENPRRRTFLRYLRQDWDFLGISFVIPFFSTVVEMCRLARSVSPRTKIVLGGPGVQCLSHATGREDELCDLADYVCRGEGVRFLRKLLSADEDAPIRQQLPLPSVVPFRSRLLERRTSAPIVTTLGCTNACDFCSASAFHGHRRIRLASPREAFEAIRWHMRRYGVRSATILDDNMLLDPEFVGALGSLLRKDPICRERGFTYSTAADLSAIARYDFEELVANGIGGLLIGIESKFCDELAPRIARKVRGVPAHEVIQGLLDHGIYVEGSMILGWDFHTPENIREDIEYYTSLGATFDQIVPLVPVPETALWRALAREGRLRDDISWDDTGFYTRWHRFKNFEHEEIWSQEDHALRASYENWGPSYLRLMDVHLRGYHRFARHRDPYLRSVAEGHRQDCRMLLPLIPAMRLFAPSDRVRSRIEDIEMRCREVFGKTAFGTRFRASVLLLVAGRCHLARRFRKDDTVQPREEVYAYDGSGKETQHSGASRLVLDFLPSKSKESA